MIEVLLSWLALSATAFVTGFALLTTLTKKSGYRIKYVISYFYAGIGVLTVYAEAFSLFYKVSLLANLVILITCVILCVLLRKPLAALLTEIRDERKKAGWLRNLGLVLLILFFAMGASAGYMHYDSDLYHAQSIRWIEEYGVVAGLGNLQSRFAYNSAAFPLTALFSFSYLGGASLHTVAGFLALLLAVLCMDLFRKDMLKRPRFIDLAYLTAIYYLCTVFDEMTAPASDYFIVLAAFAFVLLWLRLLEERTESYVPYALLALFTLIIVSYKLSAALLALSALYPAILMLREKRGGKVVKYILLGVLILAPFLARNIILSGYLVYPVTGLDLFSFDFKIPKAIAEYDSREIRVYARGYLDISRFDEPMRVWFSDWFRRLGMVDKTAFCLAAASLPVTLFGGLYVLLQKKRALYGSLFLTAVMAICFVFWMRNAPLVRYGCVFLYLAPVLGFGFFASLLLSDGKGQRTVLCGLYGAAVVCFFLYKAVFFGRELVGMLPRYGEHLLAQQDYGDYTEVIERYEIDGVTVYYPTEGDRTGYAYFPSSTMVRDIHLRGADLKDGFYDDGQ